MFNGHDCADWLEDEVVARVRPATDGNGRITDIDAEDIADALLADKRTWVGVDVLHETIIYFFLNPNQHTQDAIAKGDWQELGVLLSEAVHEQLLRMVYAIVENLEGC